MLDETEHITELVSKSEITPDIQFLSFIYDDEIPDNKDITYKNGLLQSIDLALHFIGYNGSEVFLPTKDFPEIIEPCLALIKNKKIIMKLAADTTYTTILKVFQETFK